MSTMYLVLCVVELEVVLVRWTDRGWSRSDAMEMKSRSVLSWLSIGKYRDEHSCSNLGPHPARI